jgi:hypothetical protein
MDLNKGLVLALVAAAAASPVDVGHRYPLGDPLIRRGAPAAP